MFRLVLAILLALVCSATAFAAELTIFAKVAGQPKHYLDENGKPSGYAVEIAVEAVRRAGYDPAVRNVPWSRAVKRAEAGKGLITAFSHTKARGEKFLFTEALFVDRVLLWYLADRPVKFDRYEDLLGKHIGLTRGSRYSGEFDRVRGSLTLYEDSSRVNRLRLLDAARLDAAIFSGDVAGFAYVVNRDGHQMSRFAHAEKPLSIDPNHLGVPRNLAGFSAEQVRENLNEAIRGMKADGTIERILAKYR